MIRQIRWPIWLIILFLMLSLVFTIGQLTLAIQDLTEENIIAAETHSARPFTSFVDLEKIYEPIQKWVLEEEQFFLENLEKMNVIIDSNFTLQIDSYKVNDKLYSIMMTAKPLANNDDDYSLIHTFTVDLEHKKLVELNELLEEEKLKTDQFYEIVEENSVDELDIKRLDRFITSLSQVKWTMDEDNIMLYFNGTNSNLLKVKIPIIQLHNYIRENYRPIVLTEEILKQIQFQPRDLDKNGKYIALTFDDGPSKNVTPRILKTLKKYDAKATFYMVSENVKYHPKTAKQVADAGHEIANHTVSHPNLNKVSKKKIKKELSEAFKVIETTTGETPKTFRPPYGEFNQTVVDYAVEMDQSVVIWSVDTLDWKYRNANSVYKRTKSAEPGSIVLMHDIYPTTADALPKILKYFSEKGFEFVTVSELLPLIEGEESGLYYGN